MDNLYLRLVYYYVFITCVYQRIYCAERCWYTFNHTENEINCMDTFQVNLSRNTSSVIFSNIQQSVVISNFTFSKPGWRTITSLKISCRTSIDSFGQLLVEERGFFELHSLLYLRISCVNLILEENAFSGLNKLHILDISGSANLSSNKLLSSLKNEHLGNLKQLFLVQTGNLARDGFDMGYAFWNFIGKSRIYRLDVRGMIINRFHVPSFHRYCDTLRKFDVSGTRFTRIYVSLNDYQGCGLTHIYTSNATVVENINVYRSRGKWYFSDNKLLHLKNVCIFPNAVYRRITLVSLVNDNKFKLERINLNAEFQLQSLNNMNIIKLELRNNNLNSLNHHGENGLIKGTTLNSLSITHNYITFIAPSAISNITTLVYLDLSFNNLHDMNMRHRTLFENLLSTFFSLHTILMVRNLLSDIPENMFLNNNRLEIIHLSDNLISKVTFKIEHLKNLRVLDMQRNRIHTLDSSTMLVLQNLFEDYVSTHTLGSCVINLSDSPLSCSSCSDQIVLTWLGKYRKHIYDYEITMCMFGNGTKAHVLNVTIAANCSVIETHPTSIYKNIVIVGVLFLSPLVMVLSATALRYCIDVRKNNRVVNEEFAYFVFLSFSSKDDLFVDTRVMHPLTQCLRRRIKHDIEPVGTGDTMFRAGMYIHDEIISCLEQSKVMIILLTDHYCRSECCVMEFQRAIQLNKPIIIMVKDKVDKTLLTPAMRMSYNTNSRIIWKQHDGEYVLKGTWNTICDSIMELGTRPVHNHYAVARI